MYRRAASVCNIIVLKRFIRRLVHHTNKQKRKISWGVHMIALTFLLVRPGI